jgi:acyl-CoA synthetase (AMP-forming)/AMP-acid ligase II
MPGVLEVMAFLEFQTYGMGERLAVVIFALESAGLTEDAIKDFARQHLGAYKIPRQVLLRREPFPRTATGKARPDKRHSRR